MSSRETDLFFPEIEKTKEEQVWGKIKLHFEHVKFQRPIRHPSGGSVGSWSRIYASGIRSRSKKRLGVASIYSLFKGMRLDEIQQEAI